MSVKKLNDNAKARWAAMIIVSFTMMCGYFVTDVMAPLEELLTMSTQDGGLGWTSGEYGFFSGAYGYINVFLLMLFFGGLILDKFGVRFTGTMSTCLMLAGALIKWWALSTDFGDGTLLGFHYQVLLCALGFSIFGMGAEITGITVTKIIAKWFTGHEMALAMGLQVAMARIGTAAALAGSLPFVQLTGHISASVLLGASLLCIGFLSFMVYNVMDRRLDATIPPEEASEEGFKFADLKVIFTSPGFWLITLLCLLFYAGVFPFLKFATKLMIVKYGVGAKMAGLIPAMLPFGTILLTPVFGGIYDRIGRGATLMIIGSVLLTIVHVCFALPILPHWWFAVLVMLVLGIAFSLVPSAMWPSVPKIIPMKQLGSAYAIIFYIQNIGLSLVPVLIGKILEKCGADYTVPMSVFAAFGFCAIVIALLLKRQDAISNYGLERKNL